MLQTEHSAPCLPQQSAQTQKEAPRPWEWSNLCSRKKAFLYTDTLYQMLEGHKGGYHTGPGYKLLYQRDMWWGPALFWFLYICQNSPACALCCRKEVSFLVGRKWLYNFVGRRQTQKEGSYNWDHQAHTYLLYKSLRREDSSCMQRWVRLPAPAGSPGRDKMEVLSRSQVTPFCMFTFSAESSQITVS